MKRDLEFSYSCVNFFCLSITSVDVKQHLSKCLVLNDEHRLWVFENRILRRIFGSRRDVNGEWRRLHNEEINSLYRSPNIVRVIKSRKSRWSGHVARMEEGRSVFKILTGKPTGKRVREA